MFRYRILRNLWCMATLEQKITAELMLRSMVDKEGLPEPDHIEYGHTCIRAIWWESKVALVIDIDELGPEAESLEDLGLDPTDLGGDGRCELEDDADGWEDEPEGWNEAA